MAVKHVGSKIKRCDDLPDVELHSRWRQLGCEWYGPWMWMVQPTGELGPMDFTGDVRRIGFVGVTDMKA